MKARPSNTRDNARRMSLTPYSLRKRRARGSTGTSSPDLVDYTPSASQIQVLEKFVSRTCHLFCVSPLWKFETASRNLKDYSDSLTKLLVTGSSVEGEKESNQLMGSVDMIRTLGPDNAEAVRIIIRHKNPRAAPLCTMILCRMCKPLAIKKGFRYLPLMLVHGTAGIAQVVVEWLQKSFDCVIQPFKIEEECLRSLAAEYAPSTPSETQGRLKGLHMFYHFPDEVKKAGLNSVEVEVPYDSVLALVGGNRAANPATLAPDESSLSDQTTPSSTLLKRLEEDIVLKNFNLKLSSLKLVQISTSTLHVQNDGTIKFCSANVVIPVLHAVQQSMT